MGLLDALKDGKKEKEPRYCYKCGNDCSGFMKSMKLADGVFACNNCYPFPTKLMNAKGVVDIEFRTKRLSSAEVDQLIEYRKADQKRQETFEKTETYLDGQLLVDRKHMWFRLEEYEEVFFIQQVELIVISDILEKNNKYYFTVGICLQNKYYKHLFVEMKLAPDALFKTNRRKQMLVYISEFHQKFCPNAYLDLGKLQIGG